MICSKLKINQPKTNKQKGNKQVVDKILTQRMIEQPGCLQIAMNQQMLIVVSITFQLRY